MDIPNVSMWGGWHKIPGIYFSDLLICPLRFAPSSSFQPLCWYPDTAAASVGQEMKVFPPNLPLWPFITQKPEVPAVAASHFYNELILHDRIASYLRGGGRSRTSRLLSLALAPPACSLHIPVSQIHPELLELLSSHHRGEDKVKGTEKWSPHSRRLSLYFYRHAQSHDQHRHVYAMNL